MAFKDLHKLKKVTVVEKEFIKIPYLVVGKDIFALSIYKSLQEKYGSEKVRLLSEDTILKSDLLPKGPSSIRGESNQKIVQDLYPQAVSYIGTEPAMFYKDMTWKSFGGRSKSEALKFNEEFFTGPRFDIKTEMIFPELRETDDFLSKLNQEAYQVKIKAVKKTESGFSVECLNGTEFECEKLYFGQSPYQFLQFYSHKSELSDKFIEFCESTQTPSALFVKFVFDKPITDSRETLFIPLSYTHDWGHFVGEFGETEDKQSIEFIHFVDEDHTSEEDLSRVIRLLKKGMEKIFEKFSKINSREYIVLEQEIGCLKIDDQLFVKALSEEKNNWDNLFFLGINAPIRNTQCETSHFEYSRESVSVLSRALLAHALVCEKSHLSVLTNTPTELNI